MEDYRKASRSYRTVAPVSRLPPLDLQNVKEAESVVFKAFGASRKLSERNKRHLANIIAIKSQVAQQELLNEIALLTCQLNATRQRRRRIERSVTSFNTRLVQFIENNRQTFTNKLVDTRSTTDVLLLSHSINNNNSNNGSNDNNNNRDILQQLDSNVQLLIDKFSRLIIEARHISASQSS